MCSVTLSFFASPNSEEATNQWKLETKQYEKDLDDVHIIKMTVLNLNKEPEDIRK